MVRHRMAKLEKAMGKLTGGWCCGWCGGTRGAVARVPLIIFNGDRRNLAPFDADGRCPRCGSEPSHVVNIKVPLGGMDGRCDAAPPTDIVD